MDHDDLLAPDALFEIAIRLEANPDIDVFYTDEDKVSTDLSEHFQPHFKPDFNLDLLRSNNYICHFFVVKRTILKQVKGLDPKYNGAQDYDFIFRCTELSKNIVHIPRILYHWRVQQCFNSGQPRQASYTHMRLERKLLRTI